MQNNRAIPEEGNVDIVYIWCDPEEEEYVKNKKHFSKEYNINSYWSATRNHEEILHSIQSVRKHMKWAGKIFVCTPKNHRVKNLDETKYGVEYVSNEEILGEENCPSFNSHSLELFSYKIPGLSDYFIQCNDDFFINNETQLVDFYNFETNKIKYFYENFLHLATGSSTTTGEIVQELVGEKYYFWAIHGPRMYYREDVGEIVENYPEPAGHTKNAKFRNRDDIQLTHLYGYYLLSKNQGEFIFLENTTSANTSSYLIKMLFGKIFLEGFISVVHQIYIQYFYKKQLYKNKIFSDEKIYSFIHIGNDYVKNKENIDFTLANAVKFICLNDAYLESDNDLQEKISEKNYEYFYEQLLGKGKK